MPLRLSTTGLLLATLIASCTSSQPVLSDVQRGRAIGQLESARDLDKRYAGDMSVGPVASGDYTLRAERADALIARLQNGENPSQEELQSTLFIPPRHLTYDDKVRLINQLQHAKWLDDRGWYDYWRQPAQATDFLVQGKKAEHAILALESNQPISWTQISEALSVPPNP
jgi:hypothetical protein